MATFTDADVIEVDIQTERDTYEYDPEFGQASAERFVVHRNTRVEWRLVLRATPELMNDGGWWDELLWQPHGIRLSPISTDMRADVTRDLTIEVRAEAVGELTNQQVMNALAASRGRRRARVVQDEWPTPAARRSGAGIVYGPESWSSVVDIPPADPSVPLERFRKAPKTEPAKMRERKRLITLDDD